MAISLNDLQHKDILKNWIRSLIEDPVTHSKACSIKITSSGLCQVNIPRESRIPARTKEADA